MWVILSLAVFTSGWVEIPVPGSWLSHEIEKDGLRIKVQVDTAHVQWAMGRTSVTELRVALDDEQVLSAPRAQVHMGLLPLAKDFRRPRLVELSGPEIRIDEQQLAKLPQSEKRRFPRIAFRVEGDLGQTDIHRVVFFSGLYRLTTLRVVHPFER